MKEQALKDNRDASADLAALLGRLREADYAVSLGDGWTVATALAHLAFWDRRAALLLRRWQDGQHFSDSVDWYDDVLNVSLQTEWNLLPGPDCGRLALEAARQVEDAIEAMDDAAVASISATHEAYLMTRHNHRREHIQQIEAAL